MRIRALRMEDAGDGVQVWSLEDVELPIAAVVAHRFVSLEAAAPLPLGNGAPFIRDFDDRAGLATRVGPIGWIDASGRERAGDGVISARRYNALLDFLAHRYLPKADGEIESLLRRLRAEGVDAALARERLDEFLGGPLRRASAAILEPQTLPSPILVEADASPERLDAFLVMELGAGRFAVRVARHGSLALRAPTEVRIGDAEVPRTVELFLPTGRNDPLLFWDGRRVRALSGVDELPATALNLLDRHGTSRAPGTALWAGAQWLEPLFLARLRREHLEHFRSGSAPPAPARPPHPALASAALLFGTRSHVPIVAEDGRRPPVLDDEPAAAYLLEHLVHQGSLYVPGPAQRRPHPPVRAGGELHLVSDAGSAARDRLDGVSWASSGEDAWIVGCLPGDPT